MLAFFGSFRITELLPKKARTIDPKVDLLRRDIELVSRKVGNVQKRFLKVHLKSPKETSGKNKQSITVEVFETRNVFCPVQSFIDYEQGFGHLTSKSAAFRNPYTGDALSQDGFNKRLKKMFAPYVRYGSLTGHSFRSGLSSLLG